MSALCLILGFFGGGLSSALFYLLMNKNYDFKKILPNNYSIQGFKSIFSDRYFLTISKNNSPILDTSFRLTKPHLKDISVTWRTEK